MRLTSYKWGAGQGVALASLSFVENDLTPYNHLHALGIKSPGIEPFPVRDVVQAGYERGAGRIDTYWEMVVHVDVLEYIIETKFSSLATDTKQTATINTRRFDFDDYQRYSCYIIRPQQGRDWQYIRQKVVRLRIPFTGLVAL